MGMLLTKTFYISQLYGIMFNIGETLVLPVVAPLSCILWRNATDVQLNFWLRFVFRHALVTMHLEIRFMALGKNLPIYFWRRHFSVLHTVWTVVFVNYLFNNFHMRFLKMTFGNQPENWKKNVLCCDILKKLYDRNISTSFNTKIFVFESDTSKVIFITWVYGIPRELNRMNFQIIMQTDTITYLFVTSSTVLTVVCSQLVVHFSTCS